MEREIFVSTGSGIDVLSPAGELKRSASLAGAGALCVLQGTLLCACESDGAVWRLDRGTLMPQALYPGGPGLCALTVSRDGGRLYLLCADADSVMLSDAASGQPLVLNRVGSNPRQMALTDGMLAVAGGESGCVHLLDDRALHASRSLSMPGPVYSVAAGGGVLYALCLTQTLSSVLVTVLPGGGRRTLALCGMPGTLLALDGALLAATQDALYRIAPDGTRVLERRAAPGRIACMHACGRALFAVDLLGERLFACGAPGGWRPLGAPARAVAGD